MSSARSVSPKNWAAKRRKSRRIEAGRPQAVPPPAPHGRPNVELDGCRIVNCGVGMDIGPGYHVRARGLRAVGNQTAIINRGTFDGPDTIVE